MSRSDAEPRRVLTNFVGGASAVDPRLTQEWLVTNGIGGYASGTILGRITRRYHGLLIAALPNPLGRFMMLHALFERIRLPGRDIVFAGPREFVDEKDAVALTPVEFRLECGLPSWEYDVAGCRIEKRLLLPYKQNTVYIAYRYVHGRGRLRLWSPASDAPSKSRRPG